MREIYLSREQIIDAAQRNFRIEHHTSPEEVQVARAWVEQNCEAIERSLANSILTEKQYDEMIADGQLQKTYAQMVLAFGNDSNFELLYKDIKNRPGTLCGWLDYLNEHLANKLNLFPEEQDDY